MAHFDVFNGDADGICALQQLRLQSPKQSVLVTGLKRDIDLLSRINTNAGDEVTVLDISLEKNRVALEAVLESDAAVFYADHHFSGEIPQHENLDLHIDVSAGTCTSLIINGYLEDANAKWAVVGAYGDNFDLAAKNLGLSIGLNETELSELQQLGICLNYNSYGFELEDLMFHPAELFKLLHPYQDPMNFLQNEPAYQLLLTQYQADMMSSKNTMPESSSQHGAIYILPNEAWAKRVVGVMGNTLAKKHPDKAHALIVDMGDDGYRVSVRAAYNRKQGADELCRQFESGGGRQAAAGINQLSGLYLAEFKSQFYSKFSNQLKR